MLLSAAISVGPVAFTPPAAVALGTPAETASALRAPPTLIPDTGRVGTLVTVTSTGWGACQVGQILFANPDTYSVGTIAGDGTMHGTVTVPGGAAPGPHDVTVSCSKFNPALVAESKGPFTSTFTVTATPEPPPPPPPPGDEPVLSADVTEGPVGTPVTFEGSDFDSCYAEGVELSVIDGPVVDSPIDVSETGHFTHTANVPDELAPGPHTFRAACNDDGTVYDDVDFTVTADTGDPTLSLDTEKGAVGDLIGATATGFTCTEVQLLWDGTEQLATSTADGAGTYDLGFTVPEGSVEGSYTVRAECLDDAEQYAEVPFSVTPTGGGTDNGGTDNGGTDNGGTDNGGTDNGGTDNGGTDNGGTDNGGTDNGGTDNGGTDNGGGSGGSGGGSTTPVGVVVGGTSGAALALAAAALVYFGRLHRGPRWVHKHIRATLRPATGATALTETRQPGDPPTHTTRLDPHADPGRQRLEGDGSEEEER
ncbi:hypothetical protein [Streptomyces sp. NPDC059071]|uniref:hypothetical protein n=1 Tax=unclassified Streptomyces TaxID=2593676 RepID=UPI00364B15BF